MKRNSNLKKLIRKLLMRYRIGTLLALLALSTSSIGCATSRSTYVLTEDIHSVEKGATITAPKNGYFVSDDYMKYIINEKVNS